MADINAVLLSMEGFTDAPAEKIADNRGIAATRRRQH